MRIKKEINNICPIFTYSVDGSAKIMWMGDLETVMQQEYYDCYKNTIPSIDILFQPHHGRKTGSVPDELLQALNPKLIIIGNAPADYIDYGDSRQTITQNTAGDIVLELERGFVHIYTKNKINNPPTCLERILKMQDKWHIDNNKNCNRLALFRGFGSLMLYSIVMCLNYR